MKPSSAPADAVFDPFSLEPGAEPDIDIGGHHSSPRWGALQWSPRLDRRGIRAERTGHDEARHEEEAGHEREGSEARASGRATRLRNKVSEGTFARDRLTVRGGTKEMGEPILLPKFELPGDKTHWAVRLAVISGITLLAAVVCLGAVIMHRHKLEVDAHVAREEAI